MATIEIDGEKVEAEPGQMIIEVADEIGVRIPRFCYHKKLSVAANCRMCLVEVDGARKPMPACATPISDGMKVYTQSKLTLDAQRSVMEFLLINHPLDCPICDQGGECELQDVSLGYGEGISRYTEGKRSVDDDDIGSLISTEMTRCIHCTRCVRFGEEVAGIRELGATGRGENMQIGTYVKHSLTSPVAANIIDLCPVGALTNKPYRFTARAWELQNHTTISPHDCLGSNMNVHVRRQQVMRVVPEENESINETWIADRDRYSCYGIEHHERVTQPLVKQNGQWIETDWATAFEFIISHLKPLIQADPKQVGALATPSSTTEEFYLLQKLMRGLGSNNIDHRLRESDFRDQDYAPLYPGSDCSIAEVEGQEAILIIGGHIQQDVPILATRIRKASLQDAKVMTINAVDYPLNHPLANKIITDIDQFAQVIAELIVALDRDIPQSFAPLLRDVTPRAEAKQMAQTLLKAQSAMMILGFDVANHPRAADLRSLAKLLGQLADVNIMQLTEGANAAGAWLAGAVPHRQVAGHQVKQPGLNAGEMFSQGLKAYLIHGFEPEFDYVDAGLAQKSLKQAQFVCVINPFRNKTMMDYADVILPSGVFTETSGTYINVSGDWQRFKGCTKPAGEARPAWKILRVLGNLFELDGFDYMNTEQIANELADIINEQEDLDFETWYYPKEIQAPNQIRRLGRWAIYNTDGLCRRSVPLQQAASHDPLEIVVHPNMAEKYNLRNGKMVTIMQDGAEASAIVSIKPTVAENTVYFVNGYPETMSLGNAFGVVELK